MIIWFPWNDWSTHREQSLECKLSRMQVILLLLGLCKVTLTPVNSDITGPCNLVLLLLILHFCNQSQTWPAVITVLTREGEGWKAATFFPCLYSASMFICSWSPENMGGWQEWINALRGININTCFHKLSIPSKCVNFNVGYLLNLIEIRIWNFLCGLRIFFADSSNQFGQYTTCRICEKYIWKFTFEEKKTYEEDCGGWN